MKLEEQKIVMLNILSVFAEFCEKNNLQYFLDAGTLLGAVRHKGYIPWDDDIDVNMPREDYERFLQMLKSKKGCIAPHIYLEYPEDTIFPFLKISDDRTVLVEYPDKNPMEVGVYIDVFPKDYILDDTWKSKLICDTSYRINLMRWFNVFSINAWKNSDKKLKRLIAWCGRKIIRHPNTPLHWQKKLIERYNKRNEKRKCKFVTTLVNGEFHKIAPVDCFSDYIMMDFEDKKFRCPIGYDTYLKCLYPGDYMQLPPPDKRLPHNTVVNWKTKKDKESFYRSIQ